MNLLTKLKFTLRHMKIKQEYSLLKEFVNKNSKEIVNIEDDEQLKLIIYTLLSNTNGMNYYWLSNEDICKNQRIVNIILKYLMEEDIYKTSSISYSDVLSMLDIKEYPEGFSDAFLEKDLIPMDNLVIASIIYSLDKEAYNKIKDKYKERDYSAFEIENQVYLIIDKNNFDFLIQNIDFILDKFSKGRIIELYTSAKDNKLFLNMIEEYIMKNLDKILKIDIYDTGYLLSKLDKNTKIYKVIIEYLKENIDKILKKQKDDVDLFEIKAIYEQFDELKPAIRQYFNNHKDEIIERMYRNVTYLFIGYEDNQSEFKEERRTVKEILRLIINELCEKEKTDFGSIKKLGEGSFSKVYQINDKVIKLGIHRNTKEIPENPYVVAPLLRMNFPVDHKEYGEQLFIEVTERVEPLDISKGYTPDEIKEILYDLYSKQRDIGIEWKDIRIENVGILLKDNIIHWPEELKPGCKQLGLIPNKTDIVLKAGDFVVLDADLQYTEEDFARKHPKINEDVLRENFNNYWLEFHNRYNKEHKRKVIKI